MPQSRYRIKPDPIETMTAIPVQRAKWFESDRGDYDGSGLMLVDEFRQPEAEVGSGTFMIFVSSKLLRNESKV